MPKRRVSNATPAVDWLRQNTIGSVAAASVSNCVGMQFAIRRGMPLHAGEIVVRDAHHAGADGAAPALAGRRSRRNAGIGERLFRGRQRKAMRAIGELEQFPVGGQPVGAEALDLGGDARRKAARIEQRDRRRAAAAGEQGIPGRGDVVADRRDQPDARNGDAATMTGLMLSGPGHGPAPNSTRDVATVLPSNVGGERDAQRAVVLRRRIGAQFDASGPAS